MLYARIASARFMPIRLRHRVRAMHLRDAGCIPAASRVGRVRDSSWRALRTLPSRVIQPRRLSARGGGVRSVKRLSIYTCGSEWRYRAAGFHRRALIALRDFSRRADLMQSKPCAFSISWSRRRRASAIVLPRSTCDIFPFGMAQRRLSVLTSRAPPACPLLNV